MQYTAGPRRSAAVLVAAAAAAVLMTGCGPADDGAAGTPTAPPAASVPAKPTPSPTGGSSAGSSAGGSGGSASGGSGGTAPSPSASAPGGGGAKPCTVDEVKVSDAEQAAVRPPGTGTGAAIVSVTNTSKHACTLNGFPTVAGAGNGSPGKNVPLAVTQSGKASAVPLAPGARAWTKLTFVNVQGEADGYCVSGATPASFPTMVIGVPGAGSHQIAMTDGVFAECDNKATVTAFSAVKPT
ncbi:MULTISPECIES: DUF4232 domain-containing protein [Streptomyces]|uniref:DUF4232 domain-containing protein n=1 Tax=Streptomyces TaxID=1883 RepID=UPI000F7835E2|nr:MULTISPECIES: DUF4232 domain-containing protein [Streptomyces]RST04565.1 DUF4232 domain-containing protein [Streptomyces sp. WAC07149]GLX21535.1 hypothetical protein Slala01_51790 [Streptomyces lavendulae subsp. lavendulae]GLX28952.1 hypothetical protein Slala02_47720 [Streptomyces lavendulae subsp. lavendulae]